MKKVYLVYCVDQWITTNTKTLIGVCSEKEKAVYVIAQKIQEDGESPLTENEIVFLLDKGQTQGRVLNYLIEEEEVI